MPEVIFTQAKCDDCHKSNYLIWETPKTVPLTEVPYRFKYECIKCGVSQVYNRVGDTFSTERVSGYEYVTCEPLE